MRYSIFYKKPFSTPAELAACGGWDVFISAFNLTDRVQRVFAEVSAAKKWWLVQEEYAFSQSRLPVGPNVYAPGALPEDDFVLGLAKAIPELTKCNLCVDISGLMRPHLMFLLKFLNFNGVKSFDALYTEPVNYAQAERTEFSIGDVASVRPVAGFEGLHQPSQAHHDDLLIIAAGYEHGLIREAATSKNNCRKLEVVGFPPLQADFYQANRLNTHRAAEALKAVNEKRPLFAPACDPFVTADVISAAIRNERRNKNVKNVYLCPLSSRPNAMGFALYHLFEGSGQAVSVIYPFSPRYGQETASGIARIWKYRVELP